MLAVAMNAEGIGLYRDTFAGDRRDAAFGDDLCYLLLYGFWCVMNRVLHRARSMQEYLLPSSPWPLRAVVWRPADPPGEY